LRIAVIPARGGSKRIPRKNIREFCGRPIIAYSIEAARRSECFDKIIVSTDDDEIAEVAQGLGADIPFLRPKYLADDFSGTNAVVKHALAWYRERDINFKFACCIYATAPLLLPHYLKQGHDVIQNQGVEFAFSVSTYDFAVQRALRVSSNERVESIYPEHASTRSQDLEVFYHDAGQFYWGKSEAFLEEKKLFSDISVPVILPRHLVQDIDTPEDWERAELMYMTAKKMEKNRA
jgi:N-acylneuraminate cytidylyltransferase